MVGLLTNLPGEACQNETRLWIITTVSCGLEANFNESFFGVSFFAEAVKPKYWNHKILPLHLFSCKQKQST